MAEAPGKVHMQHLGAKPRRGQQTAQVVQLVGLHAHLLGKLPPGGLLVVLRPVQLPGRQLLHHLGEGVAELLHGVDRTVFLHSQHRHAAGVLYHLAPGGLAVFQPGQIQLYLDDMSFKKSLRVHGLFKKPHFPSPHFL